MPDSFGSFLSAHGSGPEHRLQCLARPRPPLCSVAREPGFPNSQISCWSQNTTPAPNSKQQLFPLFGTFASKIQSTSFASFVFLSRHTLMLYAKILDFIYCPIVTCKSCGCDVKQGLKAPALKAKAITGKSEHPGSAGVQGTL